MDSISILKSLKNLNSLSTFIFKFNPVFSKDEFAKAKVARITKTVINSMCDISKDANNQYDPQNLTVIQSTIEKLIKEYDETNQQFHSLRLKLR